MAKAEFTFGSASVALTTADFFKVWFLLISRLMSPPFTLTFRCLRDNKDSENKQAVKQLLLLMMGDLSSYSGV